MSSRPRGEARRRRAFAGAAWRWDRPRAGYGVCQRPRHPAAAVTGGVEAAGERPDRLRQPACRERPVLGSGSAAGSWLLAVPHEGCSRSVRALPWSPSTLRPPGVYVLATGLNPRGGLDPSQEPSQSATRRVRVRNLVFLSSASSAELPKNYFQQPRTQFKRIYRSPSCRGSTPSPRRQPWPTKQQPS